MGKGFLIYFLYISLNLFLIYCHKCGTDSLKITPSKIKINENELKRKLDNSYLRPIKIVLDYTYIKEKNKLDSQIMERLENIFSDVINSFKSIISVQPIARNNDFSDIFNNDCGIPLFDESSKSIFMENDLLIFPAIDEDGTILGKGKDVLAAATPCLILTDSRPLAGVVYINKDLTLSKNDFDFYMKNLLFHEITHILGFHPFIFAQKNLVIKKEEYYYINSPKALEKAKIHFGCDNINGIRLENYGEAGSVGSHWESRYMLGDYMISFDYPDVSISDITLAVLEDTGYYKVNYYTGGLFRFGKNQGCAFFSKKCLYDLGRKTMFPNEFCTNSKEAFCTGSHLSKGYCYITKYKFDLGEYRYFQDKTFGGYNSADYCPISFIFKSDKDKNNDYYYPSNCQYGNKEYSTETIGANSICFESSISSSIMESVCYEMSCDKENKRINVSIGKTNVICPGNDIILKNPNGLKGNLHCPDYYYVCTSDIWCNDMFDCINKKSFTDPNSYEYNIDKKALLKRDKENLLIDDEIKDISSFIKLNYLLYLSLLFI